MAVVQLCKPRRQQAAGFFNYVTVTLHHGN